MWSAGLTFFANTSNCIIFFAGVKVGHAEYKYCFLHIVPKKDNAHLLDNVPMSSKIRFEKISEFYLTLKWLKNVII